VRAATRQLLTGVLSGALFLTAPALIFRQQILKRNANRMRGMDPRHTAILTIVVGVLVSIASVGAGAIGVTALTLLHPPLPMARMVGSDIAYAVPLTLVAGMGHWMLGSVSLPRCSSVHCPAFSSAATWRRGCRNRGCAWCSP
jgi:uncharacterized protein